MKKYFFTLAIIALLVSSCSDDENPLSSINESKTDLEAKTLTDFRDGNVYKIEIIGEQVWMAENLKYLPSVSALGTYSESATHYYVYGYDGTDTAAAKATNNYKTYGVIYNWLAASASTASSTNPSGVHGACPDGWHLPSEAEWDQLFSHVGGIDKAGTKLKEKGTKHWESDYFKSTNEVGFTALPGGYHWYGSTINLGKRAGFWSSTEETPNGDKWAMRFDDDRSTVMKWAYSNQIGVCVRCVMD